MSKRSHNGGAKNTPANIFKHGPQLPNTIWAIGGGKGGIGKSFISSSIAICLARAGKSVTLVDLDLGGANLHTCLGAKVPELGISDFLSGRMPNLASVMSETDIPHLRFISGCNDALNIADLPKAGREKMIAALRAIPSQYVILDLGAGTSETTLDFFLSADEKIVACSPEPTAIENAYRFIKSSFYRKLRTAEIELGIQEIIEEAMDARNSHGIRSPSDLLQYVNNTNPAAGLRLASKISDFDIQIILNQVRTSQDQELGHAMRSVCRKYFGIEANYLGHIDYDNAVWQSLRKRRLLLVEYPFSSIVGQFLGVTKHLLNPHSLRAVV